jgi:hypothetical protein
MWTIDFYYNRLCPAELSIVVTTYFEEKNIGFKGTLLFG